MRRWIRHTDSLMPPSSSALCQAMACWYTLSMRVPSRSSRRAGRSVILESYATLTVKHGHAKASCTDAQRLTGNRQWDNTACDRLPVKPRCVCGLVVHVRAFYLRTFITAAYASTNPAPTSHVPYPGRGRAVDVSALSTCVGLSFPPAASCIKATTPAMCGDAIDVPDAQV